MNYWVLFILPLVTYSQYLNPYYYKRSDDKIAIGDLVSSEIEEGKYMGCLFKDVCRPDMQCHDDLLFGTCLSKSDSPDFVYDLSEELKETLKVAMTDLVKVKFSWLDLYTQCFLKTVIKSSELNQYLTFGHCKPNSQQQMNIDKAMYNNPQKPNGDNQGDYEQKKQNSRQQFFHEIRDLIGNQKVTENQNSKGNEEKINPLANSDKAVSKSTVDYEDPTVIRDELKIAQRKRSSWIWVKFDKDLTTDNKRAIIETIESKFDLKGGIKEPKINSDHKTIMFKLPLTASSSTRNITKYLKNNRDMIPNLKIIDSGSGPVRTVSMAFTQEMKRGDKSLLITFIICGSVFVLVILGIIGFCIQKFRHRLDKLGDIINPKSSDHPTSNYVDLFRSSNREAGNNAATNKNKQTVVGSKITSVKHQNGEASSPVSTRSSTSSWTDDIPNTTNMDIYTGHMILSYMEKHLKDREMFQSEWRSIKDYEAEDGDTSIAKSEENKDKNRDVTKIPYNKSRVALKDNTTNDYVNASFIVDHDPKVPVYIATQAPMKQTVKDFWQMVWEQGIVVIVNLTSEKETEIYWPKEGGEIYNKYEVNLVSEHVWSDEYLVRNFYLKCVSSGETRTVTQFHYLNWPIDKTPSSSRAILEFRRKVNKSYRSKSTPILIHCWDGCGRTGTYILLDLILNRIGKGMKEMDITATLEHLRDQRMQLVHTEEQFGFVLNTISEEVNSILKVLNN